MELRQYLLLARRWLWLLVLGTILGGAGAFVGSYYQTPVYETSSLVLVSQPSRDQLSELGYLNSYQLIQTYAQLLLTDPILEEVSQRLNYPINSNQVTVQPIRDTQILEVTVEDNNPQMAMEIANLLIDVLVDHNESIQATRFAASEESLLSQIQVVETQITNLQSEIDQGSEVQMKQIEDQIKALQTEIVDLQLEIASLSPDEKPSNRYLPTPTPLDTQTIMLLQQKQLQLEQLQGMLDLYQQLYFNLIATNTNGNIGSSGIGDGQSQTNLALYQQIYANLLGDYEEIRLARLENTPTVMNVEPAKIPTKPVRPRPATNTALGSIVGLMIAGGVVFLIEYLDDSVRSPEEVAGVFNLPPIAYVAEMQYAGVDGREEIYVGNNPRSPVAEAFRSLRTNIEFASVDSPLKTILVTSPGPMDGKSTIAANLAQVMVQGGKKVAVVDCDLRKPILHRMFDLPNRFGLSELLRGKADFSTIIRKKDEKLFVVTSGKLPPNPAELLASELMEGFLDYISNLVDVVIIDSPPAVVTDPVVISSKVDGVLLIIYPGQTKLNSLKLALDQLENAGARVIGLVFNRISRHNSYYYQYYYPDYYYKEDEDRFPESKEDRKREKRDRGKKAETEEST